MFGRRKREEAAAEEAAREAERKALFARLAERPENICPFLGLEGDRAAYVDGVSDEHRCFEFGDPTPLSAEQQTRVCQQPGYGNCPRYLRGVLVIPTEELGALRRKPLAATAEPPPPPPVVPEEDERRRRPALLLLIGGILVLGAGAAGAWALLGQGNGTAVASTTPNPTVAVSEAPPTASPAPTPTETAPPNTPTPEPTPEAGDTFAFYEVSVSPGRYKLFALDDDGAVTGTRDTSFENFSFAEVEPRDGPEGDVYWETRAGDLTGWSYLWPDSGDFRIRAVFLNDQGDRRWQYLDSDELDEMPSSTPAPAP